MSFSAVLVSAAVWLFLFRKVPSWGWFSRVKAFFPKPLAVLWNGWTECAYCGGFWVALGVRAVTGLTTITFPAPIPEPVVWGLDALSCAIGVLFVIRGLDALAALIAIGPKH